MKFIVHYHILLSYVHLALHVNFLHAETASLSFPICNIIQTGVQCDMPQWVSGCLFLFAAHTSASSVFLCLLASLLLSLLLRANIQESLTTCTNKCLGGFLSSMSRWAEVEQEWRESARCAGGERPFPASRGQPRGGAGARGLSEASPRSGSLSLSTSRGGARSAGTEGSGGGGSEARRERRRGREAEVAAAAAAAATGSRARRQPARAPAPSASCPRRRAAGESGARAVAGRVPRAWKEAASPTPRPTAGTMATASSPPRRPGRARGRPRPRSAWAPRRGAAGPARRSTATRCASRWTAAAAAARTRPGASRTPRAPGGSTASCRGSSPPCCSPGSTNSPFACLGARRRWRRSRKGLKLQASGLSTLTAISGEDSQSPPHPPFRAHPPTRFPAPGRGRPGTRREGLPGGRGVALPACFTRADLAPLFN